MSNPPFSPSALESALPVPVIGPWIARMGYAADMLAMPCHPTPTIWFYAAATAGVRVVASLYKPFNQAEIFHALGGGFRKHGLKKLLAGGHSGRGLGFIQALEELAPLKQLLKKPGWNFVQLTGELAIKAEWYLFLVDVTTDFFVNWISQAYQYAGCTSDMSGWAEGHTSNAMMLGFDTYLSFIWQTSQDVIAAGPTAVLPAGDLTIAASVSWAQFETLKPPSDVYLYFTVNGEATNHKPTVSWDPVSKTGYSTSVLRKKNATQHGFIVQVHVYWSDGWCYITNAMVQIAVSQDLKSFLNPDP